MSEQMEMEIDHLLTGKTTVMTARLPILFTEAGNAAYVKALEADIRTSLFDDRFEKMSNGDIVRKLAQYAAQTNTDELIHEAITFTASEFSKTGSYRVARFVNPAVLKHGKDSAPKSIRLPISLNARLDTIADKLGISKSGVVRSFLQDCKLSVFMGPVEKKREAGPGRKKA